MASTCAPQLLHRSLRSPWRLAEPLQYGHANAAVSVCFLHFGLVQITLEAAVLTARTVSTAITLRKSRTRATADTPS